MHHKRPPLPMRHDAEADGYVVVVFASDLPICECCEEPWCPLHEQHFADCSCLGATELEAEYIEAIDRNGKRVFMGRRKAASCVTGSS
jgi:hypothetical protein